MRLKHLIRDTRGTVTMEFVLTFPLVMEHVDDIITVTEDESISATRRAALDLKLVVEPSGALALAGLLGMDVRGLNVGVVISGGNIDPAVLGEICGLDR